MNLENNYLESHFDEVRGQFELLNHWNYLNAADQMIPGNYWLKACHDFYDFQAKGRTEDIPNPDIATHPFLMQKTFEAVRKSAKFIHADSDEVTLMYRPMLACNLIVNMIDWKKGDNVVFTDLDYPSFPFIFEGLREKYGVELRILKNVKGEILMEDMEKNIDDNTKLVSINRTTAFCGFTYDVKLVCEMAHKHGALVLDDAIQALGAIDINVHEDNVDFLVSGSYKWQCGPEGAGIFYIRRDLITKFTPQFRNYQAIELPGGMVPFARADHDNMTSWAYPLVKTAYRFCQDVVLGPAVFGWVATLDFYDKIGIDNVEKRVRTLGQYAVKRLEDIGCVLQHPTDPTKMHGLLTYSTGSDERDSLSFKRFMGPPLGQKPIKISQRALGGAGGIRVSTHFFNTEEDIDELVKVQKELMVKKL